MATPQDRIAQLAPETQVQIRSSTQLSSLTDVILGLVKNALDADAGHIDIRSDFSKGYCSVLDDGHGILKDEFSERKIGQLYFTSKSIESQTSYGRYGRFLASLSGVSLLHITSSHALEQSTNSTVLKDGRSVTVTTDVYDEDVDRKKHGTKVVVHNLFGAMPVRVKQRQSLFENHKELDRAFATLKASLVELMLAASRPCYLEVRGTRHRYIHRPHAWLDQAIPSTLLSIERTVSTLFQAGLLESADTSTWERAAIRSSGVSLSAAINLRPAPSKHIQFISVNQHSLPPSLARTLLNATNVLFDASTFGTTANIDAEALTDDTGTVKVGKAHQSSVMKKDVDRWPILYIRIQVESDVASVFEAIELESNRVLKSIHNALHMLITEFLQSHNFDARKPRLTKRVTKFPQSLGMDFRNSTSQSEALSMIKSGNGTPIDLLSGLPFVFSDHRNARQTENSILPQGSRTESKSTPCTLEWFNPQTNTVLKVDSRTGMAISSNRFDQALRSNSPNPRRICQMRTIDDVTSTLKAYFPFPQIEEALKSIVTDLDSLDHSCRFDDDRQACILGSASPLYVSGPSKVDPVDLNITKNDLRMAKILGQVDKKFILASIVSDKERHIKMILIDQHAADERVKVEELYQSLCNDMVVSLPTSITFEVSQQDMQRFKHSQSSLAACGIHYSMTINRVQITALPKLVAERCRLQPKLLIDLLRAEIWKTPSPLKTRNKDGDWLMQIGAFPQGVLDMLVSRACRSAIMFNDGLTLGECQDLYQRLCACSFPFQCAHGRPSMTIIARIQDPNTVVNSEERDSVFWHRWKAWA